MPRFDGIPVEETAGPKPRFGGIPVGTSSDAAPIGYRPTGPMPGESGHIEPKPREEPSTVLGRAAQDVLTQGGTFSPDTAKSRLTGDFWNALESTAGMGPTAHAVGKVGAKAAEKTGEAVSGAAKAALKPTPAAQRLIDAGVDLPYGAMKGGFLKSVEEKTISAPIVGDAIKSAYKRTIDSWNRATVNQVLAPFGKTVDKGVKAGYDLIENANSKMNDIYRSIHSKISFTPDADFGEAGKKVLAEHLPRVAEGDKGRLSAVLQQRVLDELYTIKKTDVPAQYDAYGFKIAEPTTVSEIVPKKLTGKELQRVRSDLRTEARSFSRSPSMSERQIGYALEDANALIGDSLARQHPAAANALNAADKAYARMVRIEEAAAGRVKSGGVFNPTDLMSSSRRLEGGPRNKVFAQGHAMLQDWGRDSQDALASVVANSGTADREMWNRMLLDMATGGAAYGLGGIPAMVGLGASALPYMSPVMRGANALVRNRSVLPSNDLSGIVSNVVKNEPH